MNKYGLIYLYLFVATKVDQTKIEYQFRKSKKKNK